MKNKSTNLSRKVNSHYDSEAEQWVVNPRKWSVKYYYDSYFKTLFDKGFSGENALDVGCGAGTFTFELCNHEFKNIFALDFSEKMLFCLERERKKRNIREIMLAKGEAEHLPFKDNCFDFVVLVGVMECLMNQDQVLKEIHRILKPGGIASIRWLNKQGIWGNLERVRKACRISSSSFSYDYYARIKDVISESRSAGFKIISVNGMIIFPFFVFSFPISWLLEMLFVRTGFVYKIEGIRKSDKKTIMNYYYSFCTQLRK